MSYLLLAVYSCIHTCIHAQHYHHAYKNITSLSHASCTCMHTPTHLVMHLAMHSPTRGTPTWAHACLSHAFSASPSRASARTGARGLALASTHIPCV